MPKDIVGIKDLSGGYNSFANPRSVQDNELTEAINVDTSEKGTVGAIKSFEEYEDITSLNAGDNDVTQGGYGLFSYSQEVEFDDVDSIGNYTTVAVYKPHDTTPKVSLLQETGGDFAEKDNLLLLDADSVKRYDNDGSGKATTSTPVEFLSIDGTLVAHSANQDNNHFVGTAHSFDAQGLSFRQAGRRYFKAGNGSVTNQWDVNGYYDQSAEWYQHKFFVEPPRGGFVKKLADGENPVGHAIPDDTNWAAQDDNVGIVIQQHHQTSRTHVGWGSDINTSQNYNFYASYVYNDESESMPCLISSATLGGNGQSSTAFNDATFYAVVRPRTNYGGSYTWKNEITAIRLYYTKADKDQDTKYYIGEYKTYSYTSTESIGNATATEDASYKGYFVLHGDKTGKDSSSYTGAGIYHYEPPRVLTHAVNSGIRANTTSVTPRFKTGVVLNRRLYVGNVAMKTPESPESIKHYPDRLLKSIANKFDVLPDTEFIDVAIKDGESIVKLEGIGNILLQYKENTLYTISVAGGSEYLSGTYKNMGVRHPNAVVRFEGGVFWVNEFGAYIFDGQNAPINIIDKKINLTEWAEFCTKDAIVGYEPNEKKFFVCGDSSNILDDVNSSDEVTDSNKIEFYTFNMLTASWNKHKNTIGEAAINNQGVYQGTDQSLNAISNFINYQRGDGTKQMLFFQGSAGTPNRGKLLKYGTSAKTLVPYKLETKEYTSQNTHQRKSIYGVYITYKGTYAGTDDNTIAGTGYTPPSVKLVCQNAGNTITTTTLEAKASGLGFTSATDWETAHFIVPTANKADTRNAYGVKVLIENATTTSGIWNDFEIADISIVMRLKNIK